MGRIPNPIMDKEKNYSHDYKQGRNTFTKSWDLNPKTSLRDNERDGFTLVSRRARLQGETYRDHGY